MENIEKIFIIHYKKLENRKKYLIDYFKKNNIVKYEFRDLYQRENLNCLNRDCFGTVKKKVISNRSTFFCNRCQK